MSTYYDVAINPATGKQELAMFIDDYFGKHKYGVRFSDGKVYPEAEVAVRSSGGSQAFQFLAKSGEE